MPHVCQSMTDRQTKSTLTSLGRGSLTLAPFTPTGGTFIADYNDTFILALQFQSYACLSAISMLVYCDVSSTQKFWAVVRKCYHICTFSMISSYKEVQCIPLLWPLKHSVCNQVWPQDALWTHRTWIQCLLASDWFSQRGSQMFPF